MRMRWALGLLGLLAVLNLEGQDTTGTGWPMPGLPNPPNWKTEVT